MGLTAPFCIVVFLAVVAPAAAQESAECANPVSIEVACRGVSDTHHGVEYDHCVRSLSVDPRSKDAGDINGLAIDHAASTESKIDDLAELEGESSTTRALQPLPRISSCVEFFSGRYKIECTLQSGHWLEKLRTIFNSTCEHCTKRCKENPLQSLHDSRRERIGPALAPSTSEH